MTSGKHRHTLYTLLQCYEPLHLGARHPYGQFRSGEAIVRGGRVLAALAQDSGSNLLFDGEANIIIEDAPILAEGGGLKDEVVHLPLTAETCKAFEGASWLDTEWLLQQDREIPHGIWDTLLWRWLVAKGLIADTPELLWGRCPHYIDCSKQCGGSTKPYPRFVQRRRDGADSTLTYHYAVPKPMVERRAHTALNPIRGTAEFGLLFADEIVMPDTTFYLCIRVQGQNQQGPERISTTCCAELEQIKELAGREIRLGGAKSRGHGLVKFIGFAGEDQTPRTESLVDRLRLFDDLAKQISQNQLEATRTYFTLTLQSPLILPDQSVHPDWCLREGDDGDWKIIFPSVAALPGARLEFVQHRFTQVTGWSSLWQLPKPALRALAAGSVYLFSTTEQVSGVVPITEELEFSGAGLRRAEGFGAINVSDAFHREVKQYGSTSVNTRDERHGR